MSDEKVPVREDAVNFIDGEGEPVTWESHGKPMTFFTYGQVQTLDHVVSADADPDVPAQAFPGDTSRPQVINPELSDYPQYRFGYGNVQALH